MFKKDKMSSIRWEKYAQRMDALMIKLPARSNENER